MFHIPSQYGNSSAMINHLVLSIKTYGDRSPDVVFRMANLMCINEKVVAPQFPDKQNVIVTPVTAPHLEETYKVIMRAYPNTELGHKRLQHHAVVKTFPLVQPILVEDYSLQSLSAAVDRYSEENPNKFVIAIAISEEFGHYYYNPEGIQQYAMEEVLPLIIGVPQEVIDVKKLELHQSIDNLRITAIQSPKTTNIKIKPGKLNRVGANFSYNVEDEGYFSNYFSKKVLLPAKIVPESPFIRERSPLQEMEDLVRLLFRAPF